MDGNAVGWFEIYVGDSTRSKAFYEAVLQTRLERLDSGDIEMWAFPRGSERPGAAGALVRMPGFPVGHNSTIVYFTCTDCAVEAARVPDNGGKIFKPKFSIGQYGFIALATDPDGNMIGLHSMK